nr:MAG TPA: Mpv17 / PMP22 family [Bacteriophage sp.]
MLDITNLYAYRIEDLAIGIVKGKSYEDAREKVKMAYLKHNNCFDSERDFIEIKEIAEDDSWFSDNPDVVEVDEVV